MLIGGRFVSVAREGRGVPLLFAHGYMSDKRSFYHQIKYFSERGFECVAFDFPGFGRSAPLVEEWSVGDYASWLAGFIAAQDLGRPHIVAHSFGARVAFRLLGEQNVADRLVIVGGAGLVKPRSAAYMRKVRAYRAVKKIAPAFAERHFGSAEYRALPPVMRGSYKKIVNRDLRKEAAKIDSPVLLIYGREDAVTPYAEEGVIFNSTISGSRLVDMPGGHFCFSEHPEKFNPLMLAFLREKG